MSLKSRLFTFYLLWLLIVLIGPLTVLRNTSLDLLFSNSVVFINTLQRFSGTMAFSLIFIQIILGKEMNKMVQLIGAKAYWIHVLQGLTIYSLILIHPTMYILFNYSLTKNLFDSLLLIMPTFRDQAEIYLVFGKSAFLIFSLTVGAAYFRTKPFLRKYWDKIHLLNYFVFYFVFYHARVGSDLGSQPFDTFYWIAFVIITYIVIKRFAYKVTALFQDKNIEKQSGIIKS